MEDPFHIANAPMNFESVEISQVGKPLGDQLQEIIAELEWRVTAVELDTRLCIWAVSQSEWEQYGWPIIGKELTEKHAKSIGRGDYMLALAGLACFELLGRTLQFAEFGKCLDRDYKYAYALAWKVDPELGLGFPKGRKDSERLWDQFRHGLAHGYATKGNAAFIRNAFASGVKYERNLETVFAEKLRAFVEYGYYSGLCVDTFCLFTLRACLNQVVSALHDSPHIAVVHDFLTTGETPRDPEKKC